MKVDNTISPVIPAKHEAGSDKPKTPPAPPAPPPVPMNAVFTSPESQDQTEKRFLEMQRFLASFDQDQEATTANQMAEKSSYADLENDGRNQFLQG